MLARIFFASSRFIFRALIFSVLKVSVFPSNETSTFKLLIISRILKISPILGTLWSVARGKRSAEAMSGSAAFFEPLIVTEPESFCHPLSLSIFWYFWKINNSKVHSSMLQYWTHNPSSWSQEFRYNHLFIRERFSSQSSHSSQGLG